MRRVGVEVDYRVAIKLIVDRVRCMDVVVSICNHGGRLTAHYLLGWRGLSTALAGTTPTTTTGASTTRPDTIGAAIAVFINIKAVSLNF